MSYFVPCSVNFQNYAKDPLSARYWKILIDIDDDDILEDVTEYLDSNQVSGTGRLEGSNNESMSNQWKVILRNPGKIFQEGDFAFAKCQIQVKLGDAEYITIFTGFVNEEGVSRSVREISLDKIEINMFDSSKHIAMKRKAEPVVYANFKICDTVTPANSIFHELADMLGLSISDLDITGDVDFVKPYAPLDNGVYVWSELQALVSQYLGILTFRYDGKLRFDSRFMTGWSEPVAEWTFSEDEGNVHYAKMKGGKITSNRVKCEFDVHEVLVEREIYRDVTNYNVITGQISIVVPAGQYFPGLLSDSDTAELKYVEPDTGEAYTIGINIQTPTIGIPGSGSDIECSGGLLTLESFNGVAGSSPSKTEQKAGASQLILYNGSGSSITITRLVLRGQPIRISQKVKISDQDATILNDWEYRDKQINGKYAVSPQQSTITTQWWVEYGKIPREIIEIETYFLPQIQEGALVNLELPFYGKNMSCQVVSYGHTSKGSMRNAKTKLVLREWITYLPATDPNSTDHINQGNATAEGIDDVAQEIATRPTYSEVQDGYTQGGGTMTPTVPTLAVIPVATKALQLFLDRQLNLTNFDHYEVQVCADNGAGAPDNIWYELRQDGVDWKGSADPAYTEFEVELFNHVNIPHIGNIDDPAGRTLHYRVRRVTKVSTKSAWSTTAYGITNTVDNGDIARASVYANTLVAGLISTMIAEIQNYVQIGGGGVIGRTYGYSNGYQDCGLSGIAENTDTGLSALTYYYKVNADGEGLSEYSITFSTVFDYNRLLLLLNNASIGVTWELVNGDLRCTSKTVGADSSIVLGAGTTGTDLFASLDGFTAFETAVDGDNVVFQHGSTRARIFQDSLLVEFWNGSEWVDWMKLGGRYNDRLMPFYQGQGLIPIGGEGELDSLDYGDIIPDTGVPRLFRFDNNYEDQDGVDDWNTKTSLAFDGVERRFGTHSLKGSADGAQLLEAPTSLYWSASKYFDFWHRSIDSERREKIIFQMGTTGYFLSPFREASDQTFHSDSSELYFDSCKLSDLKIAVVFRDSSNNIAVQIGVRSLSESMSFGSAAAVLSSYGGIYFKVIAIEEDKIAVSYHNTNDDYGYVIIGSIFGTTVTFGLPVQVANDPYDDFVQICRLATDKIVVLYREAGESTRLMVGNIDNTTLVFGSEQVPPSSFSGIRKSLMVYLQDDRFLMFYSAVSDSLVVGNVDGTTITFGTPDTTIAGVEEIFFSAIENNRVLIAYIDSSGNIDIALAKITGIDTVAFSGNTNILGSVAFLYGLEFGGRDEANNLTYFWLHYFWNSNSRVAYVSISDSDSISSGVSLSVIMTTSNDECNIIAFGSYHFMTLWKEGTSPYLIKYANAACRDWSYLKVGRRFNPRNSRDEYFAEFGECENTTPQMNLMKYSWQFTGVEIWRHLSINYDQSSDELHFTVNGESATLDVSSVTLSTVLMTMGFYLDQNEYIDDLLLDLTSFEVTEVESIEHFKKFIKWAIDLDSSKDLILSGKDGGSVFIPSILKIAQVMITQSLSAAPNLTPVEGDYRFYIDPVNEKITFDHYESASWENKIQIGGKVGDMPIEMMKGQGIYHKDITIVEDHKYPFGHFIKIDFENNVEDQRGLESIPTFGSVAYDSTYKKFGSYSLTGSVGGTGGINTSDFHPVGESLAVSFWLRTGLAPASGLTSIFDMGANGNADHIYIHVEDEKVSFFCKKGGVSNQIDIIDADLDDGSFHLIYFIYDSDADTFYVGVDDVTDFDDSLSGTWGSGSFFITVTTRNNNSGWTHYIDQFVYSPFIGDIQELIDYYNKNVAFNDNISDKDISIIVPESGRIVHYDNYNEKSLGTLHMIKTSDRNSSWTLNGGNATSFTDIDFSVYTPFGVRAVLIESVPTRTGGPNYLHCYYRAKGSTETNTVKLHNYGFSIGLGLQTRRQLTIECNQFGVIQYYLVGTGSLHVNIKGYYI